MGPLCRERVVKSWRGKEARLGSGVTREWRGVRKIQNAIDSGHPTRPPSSRDIRGG